MYGEDPETGCGILIVVVGIAALVMYGLIWWFLGILPLVTSIWAAAVLVGVAHIVLTWDRDD